MRIFITGGTGQVGSRLVRRLQGRNDQAVVLSRRAAFARERFGEAVTVVEGDPMRAGPWADALAECDAVVHLAGENVFGRRWSEEYKALLRDSRVKSTENVVTALLKNPQGPSGRAKVLVNASAIGYYGPHGDEELTEDSPPGDDTLARLCVEWEKAARGVEGSGVRLVLVRIGVVLDKEAGALRQMLGPFKWFVGGPVGSGRQYVSWIHHNDLVSQVLFALDNEEARGPLNGTAPNPVTNKEFSKALGRALHRPSFMRVPKFMLRVRFGQVAELITTGQRVVPRKALALGFKFKFEDVDSALKDAVAKGTAG
jgi:uncharacterized protein (TIGR01777 family)